MSKSVAGEPAKGRAGRGGWKRRLSEESDGSHCSSRSRSGSDDDSSSASHDSSGSTQSNQTQAYEEDMKNCMSIPPLPR